MPFQSEKQRKYLHANHPEIAKRWERDYANGGISNLFKLKEGENIRLQPHTASDLLVQKTLSGERPKYQPPGHVDAAPSKSSSGNGHHPHGGIASTYSTPDTKTTTTTTGADFDFGPDQEEDVAKMMLDMGITPDHSPDYGRGWVEAETDYGAGDYMGSKDKVRIQNDILYRKQKWDKDKWKRDVKTGIRGFSAITNPFSFIKFVYEQNKQKKERISEIDEDLELLNKIGSTKFSPHTDTIYQQLEQEKLDLLQPKTRDTPDGGPDGPIAVASITYDDIEDKNKKERASAEALQIQEKVDRSKQDAYYAAFRQKYLMGDTEEPQLMSVAQGGRIPGYNTGGLSNLFRLKNR